MNFKQFLNSKGYKPFTKSQKDGPMIEIADEEEAGHLDLSLQHEHFVRVDSFEMMLQSENPNAYYLDKEFGKTMFFFKSEKAKLDALTFR